MYKLKPEVCQILMRADSELSAIARGRAPSSKEELLALASELRNIYESKNARCLIPVGSLLAGSEGKVVSIPADKIELDHGNYRDGDTP